MSNVYYSPESYGLTLVRDEDIDDGYGFDIVALWRHKDGRFFMGHDNGCSCPGVFEDATSLDALARVFNAEDVRRFVAEAQPTYGDERFDAEEFVRALAACQQVGEGRP